MCLLLRSIAMCAAFIHRLALPKRRRVSLQNLQLQPYHINNSSESERNTDLTQHFKLTLEIIPMKQMVFRLVWILVHQELISLHKGNKVLSLSIGWVSRSPCEPHPNHRICEWKRGSIVDKCQGVYQKEDCMSGH